ncbi:pyridoxamine 5'-phosphate oxidase family protein [Haloactinomyces albus]|uniref:Pyridoxine 5'-phosphate oxidase superfamily flavin-nucleotide-binding protein n=1 Tax=Haloactinomyces albus TaxID=1352928 RepID=A0AAE3ZBX8_9ACTN|nr:pyridoxamine 5'-phosphate oxidase family protein [Haloactinomyces albus]MDR7302103.1 putative pyridoxine 5'-phosphate oxidase superfamily flavin-nucleotide-binding protein [Haloactinomyces albus]
MISDRHPSPDPLPPTGTATADLLELEIADSPTPVREHATRPMIRPPSQEAPATRRITPAASADLRSPESVGLEDPLGGHERTVRLHEPGSSGEHLLQCAYSSEQRAKRFYDEQVLDHLNSAMKEFVARMEMMFISTADARGECDSSLRAGPCGFIEVLDSRHLAYPEYRGNGVMASLGNISENPHIGILLVDFVTDLIGLHVNGKARIVEDPDLRAIHPQLPTDFERGRTPERWVVVQVEEAYIHCRKHIPRMEPAQRQRAWGTDNPKRKGGDYFAAKGTPRPWHQTETQRS